MWSDNGVRREIFVIQSNKIMQERLVRDDFTRHLLEFNSVQIWVTEGVANPMKFRDVFLRGLE